MKVPHYNTGNVEVIDAIEDWGLDKDFALANVVKYVARAGKKTDSEYDDLIKAYRYLYRRISGEWPVDLPASAPKKG